MLAPKFKSWEKISTCANVLTEHFAAAKPQNPPFHDSELTKICPSADFEDLESGNARPSYEYTIVAKYKSTSKYVLVQFSSHKRRLHRSHVSCV